MIKIARPEKSIITGKPIEEGAVLCDKKFVTYHVGEITKVVVDNDFPGDDVLVDFFDSKGRVFSVSQRAYIPLYMATCLLHIDGDRDDVVSTDFQKEKDKYGDYPRVLCSDPRVVWIALVQIWLNSAIPKNLRENKNLKEEDELVSQILTDLIPSYDEAIENLEKNKYPPFVTCRDDLVYASEKYRGEEAKERRLNYQAYLEKYGDWLIEPPKVDWDKYGK